MTAAIHGDKAQNERDWVLNEFKTGKSPIMVATDVASRGIGMIANPPLPLLPKPPPQLLLCVNCHCALLRSSCALVTFASMTSSRACISLESDPQGSLVTLARLIVFATFCFWYYRRTTEASCLRYLTCLSRSLFQGFLDQEISTAFPLDLMP